MRKYSCQLTKNTNINDLYKDREELLNKNQDARRQEIQNEVDREIFKYLSYSDED